MGTLKDLALMSIGVFICTALPGLLPIWIGAGRQAQRAGAVLPIVNAVAAGLFMGTAISVIIPEGTHFLLHDGCSGGLPKLFGVSISLGFAFMLIIDRLPFDRDTRKKPDSHETASLAGNGHDQHRHHNHSTFIGLLVHSAADGVAMGAVSLSHQSSVEFLVFLALILHKAPASFTLTALHLQQNRPRSIVIRNLGLFSAAAPIASILTFILFADNDQALSQERLGALMLFSAGTFLFVAAMHILPETLKQENGSAVPWSAIAAVIFGLLLPSLIDMGHSHGGGNLLESKLTDHIGTTKFHHDP